MYRIVFNVIDGELCLPESVERLWGRGDIHYTFPEQPDSDHMEYVSQVLQPDWMHVGDPYQGLYYNTNIDRYDIIFSMYSHEVIDTNVDLLNDIKYLNVWLSYPVDVYYMYDEKHYYSEYPYDRVAEPRIFHLAGDGRKRHYLPLKSGNNLAPDYVGDMNSYGVTVATLLNYSVMKKENTKYKRWERGGLIAI